MSIKIHHGPGGSFKTSGGVADDIIKIMKSGRMLVTNIRGFSKELAIEVLGKEVHENFDVLYLDTDDKANREKMARFFHWAPQGAYIFIDEVQRIWNPKATTKEIATLCLPPDEPVNNRPENLEAAFDMHRHQNWDFCFTTTNIKKVHPIIRGNAEFGYRHLNMGLIGIKGVYKEVTHDSSNDGMSKANQISVQFKWIPKKVFKLYKSTTTGEVSDTIAGKPLWKDPKILVLVLGLICFWTYLLGFRSTPQVLSSDKGADSKAVSKPVEVHSKKGASKVVDNASIDSSGQLFGRSDDIEINPYLSRFNDVFVTGSFVTTGRNGVFYIFSAFDDDSNEYSFNSDDLKEVGYYVKRISDCVVDVTYNKVKHRLYCSLSPVDNSPVIEQQESISNTFASNL